MITIRAHRQSSNFVMEKIVFKIATASDWAEAVKIGHYRGSEDDRRDGFIHLSAQHQLRGTLEKHFKGKSDLVLIAFEASSLGPGLKWERSRGDELFPHLYGDLSTSYSLWQHPLRSDRDGTPLFEEEWFSC